MNFNESNSFGYFMDEMPETLLKCYLNNIATQQGTTNGALLTNWREKSANDFSEFIGASFTWSETPEGSQFWLDVSNSNNMEELINMSFKKPQKFRVYFDSLTDLRKRLFMEAFDTARGASRRQGLDYFLDNNSGRFKEFIDLAFTWSNTRQDSEYWREIAAQNFESVYVTRTEFKFSEIVELITGEKSFLVDAVLLNEVMYGANAYASVDSVVRAPGVPTGDNSQSKQILKTDARRLLTRGDCKTIHKAQESQYIKHEGELYEDESALNYYDKTIIRGEVCRIDQLLHVSRYPCGYEHIEDIEEDFVYINRKDNKGVKIYQNKFSDSVYLCEASGKHYSRDWSNAARLFYVDESARGFNIIINEIYYGDNYKDQRIEPQRFETEAGRKMFLSRQSAINYGISLSFCTHCNSTVSQFHDVEQCKLDNFKNERFDYHSRKPKRTYSRAEFKIGVEIEKESYEGATNSATSIFQSFGWVKERDGSLNDRVGYELVSPTYPLFSNKIISEAEQIEAKFPKLINGEASSACGGHIHFSRKNTSGANTLEMYCGYLPLLYAIYKGRTKQNYSQAMEKESMKNSSGKYQAVRVLPDRIEFRIFPAVKNLSSLKWRIELIRYMAKNPTASPLKVVNDLCDKRTALYKLFKQIFSEQTIYKRALDTLTMAKQYDRNYFNIDFTREQKQINAKAKKQTKK